jgi:DNA-binding transcriptional ArsR family regulator
MPEGGRKLSDAALRMVADRFKALAEPNRLKLIMVLQDGEKNVGRIVEEVGATQANVSRHLQYLTEAGILKRRKEGLHVFYSISDPRVFDLCQVVCGSLEEHFADRANSFKDVKL